MAPRVQGSVSMLGRPPGYRLICVRLSSRLSSTTVGLCPHASHSHVDLGRSPSELFPRNGGGAGRWAGAVDSGSCSQSRAEAPWPERHGPHRSREKTPGRETPRPGDNTYRDSESRAGAPDTTEGERRARKCPRRHETPWRPGPAGRSARPFRPCLPVRLARSPRVVSDRGAPDLRS